MCSRTSIGRIPGFAVIMFAVMLLAGCGEESQRSGAAKSAVAVSSMAASRDASLKSAAPAAAESKADLAKLEQRDPSRSKHGVLRSYRRESLPPGGR